MNKKSIILLTQLGQPDFKFQMLYISNIYCFI